jgi:hypothetical protein
MIRLYTEEVARLGLTDWGVATQDEMAVDILVRKGVMNALLKYSMSQSDFVNVIDALKSRFSSLGTDTSSATYAHDWALFQSLGHVSQ